jgi:hypothetical protein
MNLSRVVLYFGVAFFLCAEMGYFLGAQQEELARRNNLHDNLIADVIVRVRPFVQRAVLCVCVCLGVLCGVCVRCRRKCDGVLRAPTFWSTSKCASSSRQCVCLVSE